MSRFYTHGAGRADSPELDEYDDRNHLNKGPQASGRSQNEYYELQQGYSNREQGFDYREEGYGYREPSFDLRADFDGEGPHWSETYGVAKQETYRPVYDHDQPTQAAGIGALRNEQSSTDPEMVTVPVLGPEWGKDELFLKSKRGQNQTKKEDRETQLKRWNRGQRGCCGIRWMTRNVAVFLIFGFIVALAITLYFTIPRAVNFRFYTGDTPFTLVGTPYFSRIPANFTYDAELFLMADSSGSYVPVQFSNAEATLLDLSTNVVIAKGNLGKYNMGHKKDVAVRFPVKFSYVGVNVTDPTWDNMYKACQHKWPGVERQTLSFRLEVKQSIIGMVTHPISQDNVIGVECPFEAGQDV